jgi:hypothetical protein
MASKASEYFTFLIIVSLIFGFMMTTVVHYLPADAKVYMNPLTGKWTQAGAESEQQQAEGTLSNVRSANPVIQAVGLVQTGFYVLDLFINSILALPQMVTIFFAGIFSFAPIDPYLQSIVLTVVLALCIITYVILLLGMILSIKSGTVI